MIKVRVIVKIAQLNPEGQFIGSTVKSFDLTNTETIRELNEALLSINNDYSSYEVIGIEPFKPKQDGK